VQPHALACSHGPHIFQPGKAPNTKPPLKCAHPFVGPCRRTRCSRTLWAALTTVRVVRPAVTLAQLSLPSSQVRCGHIPYNILSGAVTWALPRRGLGSVTSERKSSCSWVSSCAPAVVYPGRSSACRT